MRNSRTSLFLPKLYSDLNLCLQKVLVQREISDREGLRWPGLGFQKQGVSGLANIWIIPTKMTSQKVTKCESGMPELNILHRKTWSSAHSLLTRKDSESMPYNLFKRWLYKHHCSKKFNYWTLWHLTLCCSINGLKPFSADILRRAENDLIKKLCGA